MSRVTLVTGLWDIGRGNLTEFKRSFDDYLARFVELLGIDLDFVVYVPPELERYVSVLRGHNRSTRVIAKSLDDLRNWFPFFYQVDRIRMSQGWWRDQPQWLKSSPQACLGDYNPVVMSKVFLLNDAVLFDGGKSDYYFWIDAGLTNTVGRGFLDNLQYIDRFMDNKQDKFLFLNYPYNVNTSEIHGFDRIFLHECAGGPVTSIPRGGFFGGHKDSIKWMNGVYYDTLSHTLNNNWMGTEESVFCIIDKKYQPKIHNYMLEENGLVWPFFDHLKEYKNEQPYTGYKKTLKPFNQLRTALYILTYNSPEQVKWLLRSFELSDRNFLERPDLYLIDNSTDPTTLPEYLELCRQYDVTHIKKDNLGVCGGRQFAAEHFAEHDYDYHIFFEDDMTLYPPANAFCQAGYSVFTDNLFERSLEIMHQEQYDFLKLSYSEFYGTNKTQWAWYNISQLWREEYFPEHPNLPKEGVDPNAPQTVEYKRKSYGSLQYIEGEFHYCNWPLWISKEGNRKIFIDGKTQHLFEQRWMAETFYKLKSGSMRCATLALSPINHNRFVFYPAHERKEC